MLTVKHLNDTSINEAASEVLSNIDLLVIAGYVDEAYLLSNTMLKTGPWEVNRHSARIDYLQRTHQLLCWRLEKECPTIGENLGTSVKGLLELVEYADSVTLLRSDKLPDSCRELAPIESTHGNGCGPGGRRGTFEGAYAQLRNLVVEAGGNAVTIVSEERPHQGSSCFVQFYRVEGVAYDCPDSALK